MRVRRAKKVPRQSLSQRVSLGRNSDTTTTSNLVQCRYVEMLESQQAQLVAGLQELYRRTQSGQGWSGAPLKDSTNGMPLTHDILERLGALKQDGHLSESFEEDLNALQQKLLADGAGYMQRQSSHDSHSEAGTPSPIYEPVAQRPAFSNPFNLHQFPPTPPNQSPYPQTARMIPTKAHSYTPTHSNLSWNTPVSEFDDSMDFINQFDSPMVDTSMDMSSFPPQMFQEHIVPAVINPCLTMKDWAGQEDMQRYFNANLMS
jgi:hypothetical protein